MGPGFINAINETGGSRPDQSSTVEPKIRH